MRRSEKIIIVVAGLLLCFAMASLFVLSSDDREGSPIRANIDRQLRPRLEEVFSVKLEVSAFSTGYSQQEPPPSASVISTNYYVDGEPLNPSQVENGLVSVLQSLGVREYQAGVVGNTAIVIFEGLSIEGGIWSGFIEAHKQMVGWYFHQ